MSYAIAVEDEAAAFVRSLSIDDADAIFDGIDRLALQPTVLSQPGKFPHVGFQTYSFPIATNEGERNVTVAFRYSQDEQTLHILQILITW